MLTKIELTLEQSQQGASNNVLVSIEGVEELTRNVWIKGENKAALHYTLGKNRVNTYAIGFHKGFDLKGYSDSDYAGCNMDKKAPQDENFGFLPGILGNSNFTKDPSKVTDIELTAHMIVVNSQKDSVSPLPFAAKPKKWKSQTVTLTLPKS
nr:hypothetical protein [Tanacetum cinerariifolium]